MSAELEVSVKNEIVGILGYGSTLVTSVERFFHGEKKRAVRRVIKSYPGLFDVFERGFPTAGSKALWVRLNRTAGGTSSTATLRSTASARA
jgi:hypothetical protein